MAYGQKVYKTQERNVKMRAMFDNLPIKPIEIIWSNKLTSYSTRGIMYLLDIKCTYKKTCQF